MWLSSDMRWLRTGWPAGKLGRLSVIVPTLNEEGTIGHTLDRVRRGSVWEVIVVDGRSTDRTREIARDNGATVIESCPGRGRQLSVGASIATGDTLLFLHADTSLPAGFDDYVFDALDQPGVCAGAFRLAIDAEGYSFRLIERMVNFRSRAWQMPYGDQAIFVPADVFHAVGGFLDLPIMEDYALTRRLRRVGRIEIVSAKVVTSGRRWVDHGVWRTTVRNQVCIAAYRLGVPPARIVRWREDAGVGLLRTEPQDSTKSECQHRVGRSVKVPGGRRDDLHTPYGQAERDARCSANLESSAQWMS